MSKPGLFELLFRECKAASINGESGWFFTGARWRDGMQIAYFARDAGETTQFLVDGGKVIRNPLTGMPINVRVIQRRYTENIAVEIDAETKWYRVGDAVVIDGAREAERSVTS